MDGNQSRLLEALRSHKPSDSTERSHQEVIARQVAATPLWWKRTTLPGHVTASGFVLSPDLNQILLHHHRKLDRWLQMGGHDEGDASPWITADREVREESGLQNLEWHLGVVSSTWMSMRFQRIGRSRGIFISTAVFCM